MSLKHGLLGLLNYGPKTGYELDKEFKESLAYFWSATASQIYRELDAMEQTGWLTSKRIMQEEKPNKRVYSITAEGKAELLDWLSSYSPHMGKNFKNSFLMRIFFGGEIKKEKTLELIHLTREFSVNRIKTFEEIMELINQETNEHNYEELKYYKLTVMSGEIMHKAQIEWADKAIALLEEGSEV